MNCQNSDETLDDLIIIGGARGVGKTTVAKKYFELVGGSYIHPGDQFVKYIYSGSPAVLESKVIEGMALQQILNSPKPTIVDLHYSAYVKPIGFIKGFCDDSLKILAREYKNISLYLIDLPAEVLLERRLKDPDKTAKKRKMDLETIREELRQNKEGFQYFVDFLSKYTSVKSKVVVNNSFEQALKEFD
jgi:adenylate kinase